MLIYTGALRLQQKDRPFSSSMKQPFSGYRDLWKRTCRISLELAVGGYPETLPSIPQITKVVTKQSCWDVHIFGMVGYGPYRYLHAVYP